MTLATQAKIDWLRLRLVAKYPAYWTLPFSERALLAFAYLCDVVKVREEGGNNRGEWVETFLDAVGLEPGNAWCAASIAFVCIVGNGVSGYGFPSHIKVKHLGRVSSWVSWARSEGRLGKGGRDWLCYYLNADGTGHIGFTVAKVLNLTRSIEGNTSSGEQGSQRDGGGLYRRTRVGTWQGFIRI